METSFCRERLGLGRVMHASGGTIPEESLRPWHEAGFPGIAI